MHSTAPLREVLFDDVIRVLDLGWPLTADPDEDEIQRYVREKSSIEALVVSFRLTVDAADGRFTLDDPCNLMRVDARLHSWWKGNAWTIVPTHLEAVTFWITDANKTWQDAVATDEQAGRDLFYDTFRFSLLTYDVVVLDEEHFTQPELEDQLLPSTTNHTEPQVFVPRDGRLHYTPDDAPFATCSLPERQFCDNVNPFIIILSAFHQFRRTLERRGALPEYLHELWTNLQSAVDALFFKPFGWDDPTARLTDAFVEMAMYGKRGRKPYRDRVAEFHEAQIAEQHRIRGISRPPPPAVHANYGKPPQHCDMFTAILNNKELTESERNDAVFAILAHEVTLPPYSDIET
ncbi:hypothetical protein EXIGLDRAFT_759463 [Exidia glandulosa HHB12029]|uniref:Uncharacterized protein n=1 Tax=Exidia glandulosa HHB12029 TaxID=1314781 RepID=A0A165PW37_EXIGL|nr:hypothetical protein EXIGLDRAFT_759463 [Exidia glandulosa HHB12029]